MDETGVVICFLRNRGEVLLLRRSAEVGSYPGLWGAVAGHAEGTPEATAREEIAEETGLADECDLVRAGEPFAFTDEGLGTRWRVHPFLFDCDSREVDPNWETAEAEWVPPTEILRRETVPDLWTSYRRVAPDVSTVADDRTHGASSISLCALAVLRDRAGAVREGVESHDLEGLARDLRDARPSMTVVRNRINRAMAGADDGAPEDVERAAIETIERASDADEAAAERAAELLPERVLTLSRSGTVREALERAAPQVFVAESRPAREGVEVAEELARAGLDVTLHVDAAVAHVLATEAVGCVVVGADTVLPDGRVVNKAGTRTAALAAGHEGIPVYAVAARDKVRPDDDYALEFGDGEAVYDGDAPLDVLNPTFDVTPADALAGVVTEDGMLSPAEIADAAEELAELAAWEE